MNNNLEQKPSSSSSTFTFLHVLKRYAANFPQYKQEVLVMIVTSLVLLPLESV